MTDPLFETPALRWEHLKRLTGRYGLFEHARYDRPRVGHGYTTDDNARALVVLSRAGVESTMIRPYLEFVLAGETPRGWHNRLSAEGTWTDRVGSDDCTGRALWGLAEMIDAGQHDERALAALSRGLNWRSRHLRANAYLLLGAASAARANVTAAERALRSTVRRMPSPAPAPWRWPEARLTYGNARVPQALIEAGDVLRDAAVVERGLILLEWLVAVERGERGFSFTPVAGRGPGDRGPAFDQQPIEAWAMADACVAATRVDPTGPWHRLAEEAALWFLGSNDRGAALYDATTGAGYDGLQMGGVNLNRGAESTLAALGSVWRLQQPVVSSG